MNKKTLKKRIAEKEMQIQRERAKQDRIQRRMDEIGRRRVSAAEKATKERFLVRLRLELYEVNNRLNWLNMELWGLKRGR